jgi:hypothetical protein
MTVGKGQKANQILSSEDNMTTTIATWNEDEQKLIAVYQEKFGMNRSNAIRKMRNELKKSGLTAGELLAKGIGSKPEPRATPAKKAQPKAKKERKPKEAGDCHLNEEMKEEVTTAARKLIGPNAAVEGIVRSSLNPKWNLYIWYGLDNGKVVSVNIGKEKEVTAKYKEDDSWAVKEWKRIQARRLRREEKAKAKLDKEEKTAKLGK